MVHYAPSQLLGDIYNSDVTGFTPVLVEVLAAVLDHEVNYFGLSGAPGQTDVTLFVIL